MKVCINMYKQKKTTSLWDECEYIARGVKAYKERTKMKKVILRSDMRGDVVKIV